MSSSCVLQVLAGRVGLVQLRPFSLQELHSVNVRIPDLNELLWCSLAVRAAALFDQIYQLQDCGYLGLITLRSESEYSQ